MMALFRRSHIIRQLHGTSFLQKTQNYESWTKQAPAVCRTACHKTVPYPFEKRIQSSSQQQRCIHQTSIVLKKQKFDPHIYEKVNILDTQGHFVAECELLVLKEFCTKFNRFTYEQLTKEEAEHMAGKQHLNPGLQVQQLKEKHDVADGAKHRKTVKMNMKELEDFKVQKVIQELLSHGSVTLQYRSVCTVLF